MTEFARDDVARLDRAVLREREASGHVRRVSRGSYVREATLQRLARDEAAAARNDTPLPARPERQQQAAPARAAKGGSGARTPPGAPARRRRTGEGTQAQRHAGTK